LRDDDIDLVPEKFSHDLGEALVASLCPTILDRNIATLNPTQFPQALDKCGDPLSLAGQSALSHKANRW